MNSFSFEKKKKCKKYYKVNGVEGTTANILCQNCISQDAIVRISDIVNCLMPLCPKTTPSLCSLLTYMVILSIVISRQIYPTSQKFGHNTVYNSIVFSDLYFYSTV